MQGKPDCGHGLYCRGEQPMIFLKALDSTKLVDKLLALRDCAPHAVDCFYRTRLVRTSGKSRTSATNFASKGEALSFPQTRLTVNGRFKSPTRPKPTPPTHLKLITQS